MNDAPPRFAEGQTGAASLLSSEEGNLRLAELPRHTVRAEHMGYRGRVARRDGRRALRWILPTIVGDGRRHHARIRVNSDFAPPMDWLRLHMATRIKIGA